MSLQLLGLLIPKSFHARWGIDRYEKRFLDLVGSRRELLKSAQGPRILIQMPQDYFCLALFCIAIAWLRPSYLGGLWHQSILSMPHSETWTGIRNQFRKIAKFFDRRKWQQLYEALDLDDVWDLEPHLRVSAENQVRAREIFQGLASKQNLLDLKIEGIHCGDLIYDTYLRYRVQPTVDLKDVYLCYLIARALDAIAASKLFFSGGRFQVFLTNYTSYIQHGIPARVALTNGVEVYSAGNLSQFFKKLSKDDSLHTTAHWTYKEKFQLISDPGRAKQEAIAMLASRFSGGLDKATLYMKSSAFADSSEAVPSGIEGVMFLHDFFDSPHCHRWMLFPDFLEWARFTLKVIQDHQLPIAIKPHPNQLPESKEVVRRLQNEFPKVRWLAADLSNRVLFKSGLRCGVSVYGTILHELAFHGIPGLAAGDHPHTAFDIAITPQTIEEYRYKLLGFRELALTKEVRDEVLAFYFMHNIHVDEALGFSLDGLGIREIGPNVSSRLGDFLSRHPRFPELNVGYSKR